MFNIPYFSSSVLDSFLDSIVNKVDEVDLELFVTAKNVIERSGLLSPNKSILIDTRIIPQIDTPQRDISFGS